MCIIQVVVDTSGFIPTFKDLFALRQYADLNSYGLQSNEPKLHDLDWFVTWTQSVDGPVNCEEALAAWNLFGDIASSIGGRGIAFEYLDSRFLKTDRKLLCGNNLPSMTPDGRRYVPEWSPDELASLAEILTTGLDLFVSSTRSWPPEP